MLSSSCVALLAVLSSAYLCCALDDDFGFEPFDHHHSLQPSINNNNEMDVVAMVGKVFHLVMPKEQVDGVSIQSYEAKRAQGTPLPLWLLFDKVDGVFWGVPLEEDAEEPLHLVIGTNRPDHDDKTTNLIINFKANEENKCSSGEDGTLLTLLIDRGIRAIKPKQRVIAINNIAKFFGLPFSAFTLQPQHEKDDISDSSVVLAGPGNLHQRQSKQTSLIQVAVGCDGRLWTQTAPLVHQLKQQARDGTITEVMGLPLIGWRVKTETGPILRSKRQIDPDGSGDFDDDVNYYDDNYDDEYDYDEETSEKSSVGTLPTTTTMATTHPHRHHHGVPFSGNDLLSHVEPTASTSNIEPALTSTSTTTTTTTEKSTTTVSSSTAVSPNRPVYEEYDYGDYDAEDGDDDQIESKTEVPEFGTPEPPTAISPKVETSTNTLPSSTTTTEKITTEMQTEPTTIKEASTTTEIVEDIDRQTIIFSPSTILTSSTTMQPTSTQVNPTNATILETLPSSSTTQPTTTTFVTTTETELTTLPIEETTQSATSTSKLTTIREVSPSTQPSTEAIDYETKNFAPYIENRLQHMSVIAGKIFRFVIPLNTFKDFEDGNNLTLKFLNARGEPLNKDSWCHFNPARREIYGLPLEEDVSKWEFVVKAVDSEGASVSDALTIQVQQHKSQRVVNHEFSLVMRIEKQLEFVNFVDWCLKTLRALGKIYNTNMSEITVRNVNYTSSDPVIFTWTNDSLPTNHCPNEEIEQLYKSLTANDRGDPSRDLNTLLSPELRVKKVLKKGLGVCETTPQAPVTPPTNFPPFLRNPVDHINATMGELLVFRVPDDTFYDPEDTDSRTLNISLLTSDRQPIKPTNWLQFDGKNREFFGIPRKIGRSEYQLVCVDSAGLPATDSLEIVVYPPAKMHYNVEFSMTIETSYDTFVNSASMQRKFVEKLQDIFGDRNATYIHLNPFKQKHESTIVTWFNKSLTTEKCPHAEINRLESIMKNNDRSISSRVHSIMDPEFPVSTIKVLPIGNCRLAANKPIIPPMQPEETAIDEKPPDSAAAEYQYLMTFIVPAIIISVMLFLASVAACVLYRRRRTGKMNVEEDGRQSYGNKGIPVIFQEELEEKPEPGTKTPVILKDEKPPLAPPEYSKSGSLKEDSSEMPYQPPPPFTRTQDNSGGRQPRPKPTPTYRKPPPFK